MSVLVSPAPKPRWIVLMHLRRGDRVVQSWERTYKYASGRDACKRMLATFPPKNYDGCEVSATLHPDDAHLMKTVIRINTD